MKAKNVYLVTCTCFSRDPKTGIDHMHAVNFEMNSEVFVVSNFGKAVDYLKRSIDASESVGWVKSEETKDFVSFVHPDYSWRIVYRIVVKKVW